MHKLVIGCGYLGRRVADAWLHRGEQVTVLTRSEHRAAEFRAAGIEPVVGDVTILASLAGLPAADTVLYAVGFDRSSGHSQRTIYVDGLKNVLSVLGNQLEKLIYISSTSVYGQNNGEWVDELSLCEPRQPNGQVCLDAERVARSHNPPQHLVGPANLLRLAGLYGPGRLIRRLEEVKSSRVIPGNPDGWLNLIHVDDAVRAVLACEELGRPGRLYLVCDDKPVTRRVYYRMLASLIDAPDPQFESSANTHGLNKRCLGRRLREELQVALSYPTIETGLKQVIHEGR